MKILILGSNGQVGGALSECCPLVGESIALRREDVDFTKPGDITRAVEFYNPDVVINAVAYTAVDKAETEPSLAMLINAVAVQELARICKKQNIWCLHYSTDYVFDGNSQTPYQETDEVNPLGVYGRTKLAGEELIQQHTDKFIILRTSWVYSWRGSNFVKTMLRLAEQRDVLNVVNDQHGCPSYAPDLAQATVEIIKNLDEEHISGVYHLSGSEQTTWFEFAQSIFSRTNTKIELNPIATTEFPTPAKRPHYSILDNSKVTNTFGIVVPGYKDALEKCLSKFTLV